MSSFHRMWEEGPADEGMDVHPERLAAAARVETDAAHCADVSDAIVLLIGHLGDLLGADGVMVDLLRDEELVTCFATPALSSEIGRTRKMDDSMTGDCLRSGAAIKSPNVTRDPRFRPPATESRTFLSMISVPLYVHSSVVGLLRVVSAHEAFFEDEDLVLARLMTGAVGRNLIQAVRAEIEDEVRDQWLLSGEGDPPRFEERRKAHLRHAERYGYPVTLLVCRLKGYMTSDVLHKLSGLVRKSDDCFRLDADEFAILMPGTAPAEASRAAERIKRAVESDGQGPSGIRVDWEARALNAVSPGSQIA